MTRSAYGQIQPMSKSLVPCDTLSRYVNMGATNRDVCTQVKILAQNDPFERVVDIRVNLPHFHEYFDSDSSLPMRQNVRRNV